MPSVPFPVITLLVLLILLAKMYLHGAKPSRGPLCFVAGCALLVLVSALRWSFDEMALRQLQGYMAIALPPLTWRCFANLTGQTPQQQWRLLLGPPAIAALLHLIMPAVTDIVLMLLYLGYGITLINVARQGADVFEFSRLSDSPGASTMAFAAGGFLCVSGFTDFAIAIDFTFFKGQQAPLLVALSQGLILPFLCLAILFTGNKPAQPEKADARCISVQPEAPETEDEAQRCHQLELMLVDRSLFLDPELTLNTLARKTGTPARHISRAVNQARGCNVSQWINGFRIQHAQRLLRETSEPVTAVMLESGFVTKSNFNREFTRLTGMSPTAYRRSAGNNPAPDLKSG